MLKTIFFIVFCLVLKYVDAQSVNYLFTPKRGGFTLVSHDADYKQFYSVNSENLKTVTKDSDTVFEMHLGIQAPSNGHILLSPVMKPGPNDAVYEFVVGGGGNEFTELRRNLKRSSLETSTTRNILSSFELRAFYIKISKGGLIQFGKEGEVPLLTYRDMSPLKIKYFSFAAYTGIEATFLYYGTPAGNGTESSPESKAIEPPVSMSDQLKRSRLIHRLPWIPPKPTMNVKLGVKVTNVKYDAFQSKLITAMSVVTSWKDESMAWYPAKFNGTANLKFEQGQIWRPKFYVLNSENSAIFDAKNSDLISMVYSGEATFHFQTKVYTWCVDSPPGYSKWPRDEYICSIVIQPWEAHEKINIEIIEPKDSKMHIFSDIDDVKNNEWEVTTKQLIMNTTVWNKVYNVSGDNQTHQSDRLIINVQLRRRATDYNIVFYTPLIVLLMFVLMSFWSEPLTMNRIWFLAGCTIFISTGLCYIDYLVPSHTMPSILVLYTTVLMGVLLAMLIQAVLMMPLTDKVRNTATMQKLIKANFLRTIFCLPAYLRSYYTNGGCSLQERDDIQANPIPSDVEEMQSEKKEFAEVIDKILFVTYSITFAAMLAAHF